MYSYGVALVICYSVVFVSYYHVTLLICYSVALLMHF